MIVESLTLMLALAATGTGIYIISKMKHDYSTGPKVKTLKINLPSFDVFVNMIEYENTRQIDYVYSWPNATDEYVENRIKLFKIAIYNHCMLWLNYDINTYPDVSSVHGVSYV